VTPGRAPFALRWLGALLVLYLAYPTGAFVYRVIGETAEITNVFYGGHDYAALYRYLEPDRDA